MDPPLAGIRDVAATLVELLTKAGDPCMSDRQRLETGRKIFKEMYRDVIPLPKSSPLADPAWKLSIQHLGFSIQEKIHAIFLILLYPEC